MRLQDCNGNKQKSAFGLITKSQVDYRIRLLKTKDVVIFELPSWSNLQTFTDVSLAEELFSQLY